MTATKNASGRVRHAPQEPTSDRLVEDFPAGPPLQSDADTRPLADLWPIYVQFDITAEDLADARRRIAHLEAENRVLRHAVSKQAGVEL